TVRVLGPGGARAVPAGELFLGPYQTSLEPDEMITEVAFPSVPGAAGVLVEHVRRHGDFAVLAVAAVGEPAGDGSWRSVRVALHGAVGRRTGEELPDAHAAGRRARGHHGRVPGPRRSAPSDAGSLPAGARAAVRLLHAGLPADRAGRRAAGPAPGGRGPSGRAGRDALPVHRLPAHRDGGGAV